MDKVFKIFVDFDGTITPKDVGETMFLTFGNPTKAYKIVDRWTREEINSMQAWRLLCETVPPIDMHKYIEFIDTFEIEKGFREFINFCTENNFEIRILSDGLDFYINRILYNNNLGFLEVLSNSLTISTDNILTPSFPHTDEECNYCANCKKNHIINFTDDEDFSIYIGDGYSDKCPAQFCDFVFAKNSLLKYCEKN